MAKVMKYLRKYNESALSEEVSINDIHKLLDLELEDITDFNITDIQIDSDYKEDASGKTHKVFEITLIEDFRDNRQLVNIIKNGTNFSKTHRIHFSEQVTTRKIVNDINMKLFNKLSRKYDFEMSDWSGATICYDYISMDGSISFEVSFTMTLNDPKSII
jgi:hypothetical protein